MTFRFFSVFSFILLIAVSRGIAQSPVPSPASTGLAQVLAQKLEQFQKQGIGVSLSQREDAYARLLEAQRYIWLASPTRGNAGIAPNARSARSALQKALEVDPLLSEAYTALAELTLTSPTADVDEAIALAQLAVRTKKDSFGGHRILARLYTFKSRINGVTADPDDTKKAMSEWTEVTQLDPKNAEAWAFLSEFYGNLGQSDRQIDALRKWVGSAAPLDSGFYRRIMGGSSSLSPESATLQLASTLIKSGRSRDAIEVIGQMVADDPENADALDLLKEAVETSESDVGTEAIDALRQAVYANPNNTALIDLLAHSQFRTGRIDEAVSILQSAITRLSETDSSSAASLTLSLGDIYFGAERYDDALKAFDSALAIRGIRYSSPAAAADRDLVLQIFERIIRTYKAGNRQSSIPVFLQRVQKVLGADDLFVVREKVAYLRELGDKAGALEAVRAARLKAPNDYSLIRLEASVLTDNGKVEEGVALIRGLIAKKSATVRPGVTTDPSGTVTVSPMLYDDFSNLLFISQLYAKAEMGRQAVGAANEAFAVAGSAERRQIAKLSLATAQEMTGSFADAETTLRAVLKESPGNPIALNNLGYFLVERNERLDEAVALVQKALAVDPNNPSYIDSLGWAYFKLGRLDDAEKTLRSAIRLDPGSATVHEHLGDVLNKLDRAREARLAWQKALVLASETEDIARLRGKLGK